MAVSQKKLLERVQARGRAAAEHDKKIQELYRQGHNPESPRVQKLHKEIRRSFLEPSWEDLDKMSEGTKRKLRGETKRGQPE